jgi:hypothetical protein
MKGLQSSWVTSGTAEGRSELTHELEQRVMWLCRRCPQELREAAAHDGLEDLRPRVREAIATLESIEQRRCLTEEELTQRRTFMLLGGVRR